MTKAEIKKLAIVTLECSKSDMLYGLLEMTAWIGIPAKKRERAVNHALENYAFRVDEAIKKLKAR